MVHPNALPKFASNTGRVTEAAASVNVPLHELQADVDAKPPPVRNRKGGRSLPIPLLRLLRQAKGLVATRHVPRIANRICSTYLDQQRGDVQKQCRTLLQTRIELNPAQLKRFLHTPMGDAILARLDRLVHSVRQTGQSSSDDAFKDGDKTMPVALDWRKILINMASDPSGISLLSFLRHGPKTAHLNSDYVLLAAQRIEQSLKDNDAMVQRICHAAATDAQRGPTPCFARYPDLRQSGSFEVECQVLTLEGRNPRPGPMESWGDGMLQRSGRILRTLFYLPRPLPSGRIPVIVGSHGLASVPEDLDDYARHLASYGYAIALPQHPGSDVTQVRRLLQGDAAAVFEEDEFVHRPLDIIDLLDDLEQRNASEYGGKLDLNYVGMLGVSFGAYTALVLAGAEPQRHTLEVACDVTQPRPNVSLLLQCRALDLPPHTLPLQDKRIAAIVLIGAVGSEILGARGVAPIRVPVLMLAGSGDTTAPLALEQFRLFRWLQTPQRYLGLMRGKAHIRNWHKLVASFQLQLKVLPRGKLRDNSVFDAYIRTLSLAFFQAYVGQSVVPSLYLTAAYGHYLSHKPFDLALIAGTHNDRYIDGSGITDGNA